MSITSGRRVVPSYFGGTCRMYDRIMPPLCIINVVLPGFNVPAAHGPCTIGVVASAASDTAPASSVPPVPDDAPLVSIDPLAPGTPVPAALPVVPVAPATPPPPPL